MNARFNSQLIGCELEVQKISDYDRALTLQQLEYSESEDPTLDEPLKEIPGINKLIFEHLVAEGYATPRSLLKASSAELARIPGISADTADKIIEVIRKQRM